MPPQAAGPIETATSAPPIVTPLLVINGGSGHGTSNGHSNISASSYAGRVISSLLDLNMLHI